MDTKATIELVDELQENIEDLEDNLGSLLNDSLAATSRKLPLLDRAKLNVLLVYSIESLLFSYLRLHGVPVKEHPVFKELTRVKQYFEKIKTAEAGPESARPAVTLNKEAAARVIRHGLAGNEKYDLERAEREAREKVLANRKLRELESKMKEQAAQSNEQGMSATDALTQAAQLAAAPLDEPPNSAPNLDSDADTDSDEEGEVVEEQPAQSQSQQGQKRKKKPSAATRRAKRRREAAFPGASNEEQMNKALGRQAARKAKKEAKKAAKRAEPAAG
ncbi:hypothetical protein G647_00042 [Cladophialophora carrionii CBS 160.54]|uniref:Exosome complex protein n=1 Tax=Cladophialophora carrionii CBS 160.54 TaxID=1279043 RepID=V9DMP7_9EURO|nr:uncharacterized protein G647_00042 [Cladophialophora carrionii CBS 160.54]ETI27593.1 hypothetical protein G647_00042 [Cladophialophora carrionii CBS 160.54]